MIVGLSYFAIPYIIMPGAAAALAGWYVWDWRLAGAVAAGTLGLALILPGVGFLPLTYALPLIVGAGIGSLALLPLLLIRPETDRWTRMTLALLVTVAAGIWLVAANPGVA